ncbi:MAG: BatD family protein [Bacteroidia bacterium]|nr:BatD family protein [Bacteroidia bacterium]
MNFWHRILFCGIFMLPAWLAGQDIRGYVSRRWLEVGEELRMILTCRGVTPIANPEFPVMEGFTMGIRESKVLKEGATRTILYEQVYVPTQEGTYVMPQIIVPFLDHTERVSAGIVTVKKKQTSSLSNLSAAPLSIRTQWDMDSMESPVGSIKHGTLYIELLPAHRNHVNWDLGSLAELADSLRRSAGGAWLLADTILGTPLSTGKTSDGWLRFPCYEAWWACPEAGRQEIAAASIRIERLWQPKLLYRGGRRAAGQWEEEMLTTAAVSWQVAKAETGLRKPAAPLGPISIEAEWGKTTLTTGQPFQLDVLMEGAVFMGLVPAPTFERPTDLIVRGPETRTWYRIENGNGIGTKRLTYLIYSANPGSHSLGALKLYWQSDQIGKQDSSMVALPSLRVTGTPISQLLHQHELDHFYDGQPEIGFGTQATFAWLRPAAWVLSVMSIFVVVVAAAIRSRHKKEKVHELLRYKRYRGH